MTAVAPTLRRIYQPRFVLWVVLCWTALRLYSAVLLYQLAHHWQDPVIYQDDGPDPYWQFAAGWDGIWYEVIATQGYPDELPRDSTGQVRQNPWAFYPIFPMLSRVVMGLTGWPFGVAGAVVATIIGYAAALVVAGLLAEKVGKATALGAVVLLGAYPAAPTMQVAYTESLALLLLAIVLWLLIRRRWLAAGVVALLTGLARPIALPLGLVALVAVLVYWWRCRRVGEQVSPGEYARMAASLLGCGLAGLVWPTIAWLRTGVPDAYTLTMSSWRHGEPVTPFIPTIERAQWLWGDTRGLIIVAVILVVYVLIVLGPWARGLGVELRTWCLGYVLYLFAALDPWTSLYRYLILLFPLFVIFIGGAWRAPGWARSGGPQPRWLLVTRSITFTGLFLAWQVWWGWYLFQFVPPSDYPP